MDPDSSAVNRIKRRVIIAMEDTKLVRQNARTRDGSRSQAADIHPRI